MDEIKLTKEQEEKVVAFWNERKDNPPSLKEIIALVFGSDCDGRSKEGIAVKAFLATKDIKARPANEYVSKVASMSLTEEQKEYVGNNCSTSSPTEMAKILFKNNELNALSAEARLIATYIKTLPIEVYLPVDESSIGFKYRPPKTYEQALNRINKYVHPKIDPKKIMPRQKADVMATMGFLHSFRFGYTMNLFARVENKELFESTFICYVYDKADLTAEEVDAYINLALDVVNLANTQQQIDRLTVLLTTCAEDSDGRRVSMSLTDAIHNAQTEYHQNKTRQQKLVQDLQGKRSDRINTLLKQNASILNLVGMWREEEERNKLLKYAQLEEVELDKEIVRLTTMEDIKARIIGISPEEVKGFAK